MPITEHLYHCQDSDRDDIHKALIKEYEVVSMNSSEQSIKITNGILQSSLGDKYIYRFQLPNAQDKQIEADRPYGLRIDKQQISGSISTINDEYVEIELKKSEGQYIPMIEIIIDLTILIDLVDRTIIRIDREPKKFEIATLNNLIRPTLIETNEHCLINHKIRGDGLNLTPEQEESIVNSISRNLNIIWGPPGTGKTKTLQGVIAEFLLRGKKVLFASNTNNAIDSLLEQFVKVPIYQVIEDLKKNDKIVRLGSQSNENVKNAFSPLAISEKKSKEFTDSIEKLTTLVKQKTSLISIHQMNYNRYRNYLKIIKEIEKLTVSLHNIPTQEELQKKVQQLNIASQILKTLLIFWENNLKNQLDQLELNSSNILKIIQQKHGLKIIITQNENNFKRLLEEKSELETGINKLKNNFIKRIFNNNLKILEKQLEDKNEAFKSLESNILILQQQLNEATLNEAEIISDISNTAKNISTSLVEMNPALCTDMIRLLKLENLLNENTVKELPKLQLYYNFITDNLIEKINFVWQLSSISNQEIIDKHSYENKIILQQINFIETQKSDYNTKIQFKTQELVAYNDISGISILYWESILFEIKTIKKEIDEIKQSIEELNNKIKVLSVQIIKDAQLICSTLVKASYDEAILESRFDVLIIDEVSMVSIPQLYCAASITKEKIVLCGDHLQLQPICQSQSKLSDKWLASSYFGLIEGNEDWKEADYKLTALKPFLSILSVQRRMPMAISSLIKPWYKKAGNDLKDGDTNPNSELFTSLNNHFLSSNNNVYIFDTKELRAYHNRTEDRSPYNFINAIIVSELLRELIEDKKIPPEKILCVSPYRAQYQLTWAIFNKLRPKDIVVKNSLISSVHRTQGNEAEIVIYDLTEGSQGSVTHFLKTSDFFIHNVAISRSKAKIIFVGDTEKLEKIEQKYPDASFNQVFQQIKTNAKIIDAKPYRDKVLKNVNQNDLMNQYSFVFTDELKDKLTIIPSSIYFDILQQDILLAKHNITIISPFITITRWNKLRPLITSLLKSNPLIGIEVLTKPPETMFGKDGNPNMGAVKVLNEFLNLGFVVKTSEKIHSKLVVIDRGTKNAISYMGSLNPLSFKDTDEINIRLADNEIAEQLIKMSLVGNIKRYQEKMFKEEFYKDDIKKAVKSEFDELKWTLAGFYHFPIMNFRNITFNYLIENAPYSDSEFKAVPHITTPKSVLLNHIQQLRDILKPLYDLKR